MKLLFKPVIAFYMNTSAISEQFNNYSITEEVHSIILRETIRDA